MKWVSLFIIPAIALAGACSSNDDGNRSRSAEVANAAALAGDIRAAGVPCAETDGEEGEPYVASAKSCEIDGETVQLYTFKDAGAKRNWYGALQSITCEVFEVETFYMVEGPNWVVSPQTQPVADALSQALRAERKDIDCG